MNQTVKEHLISAAYTFVTGFLIVVLPALSEIDLETLDKGVIIGITLAGFRMGIKMLAQLVINWNQNGEA